MSAKVLVLDIESKPIQAYVWALWKQNVGLNQIEEDWSVLTWAASWLGEDEIMSDSQANYFKQDGEPIDTENDKEVVKSLWNLLDEADAVIAHNGKRFDIPKMNARFLYWGLTPPSPYKIVDTLSIAKKQFQLTSNKLDYIAQYLGLGQKIDTGGFELWKGCMKGDMDAWSKMEQYNKHDVILLEEVYKKLIPWAKGIINLPLYDDEAVPRCPSCGGTHLKSKGHYYTKVGKYQRFKCDDCGSWSASRTQSTDEFDREKRKTILKGI